MKIQKLFGIVFTALALPIVSTSVISCNWLGHKGNSTTSNSSGILAQFPPQEGPNSFFFGVATAPAHIEEGLDDGWMDFARKGKIAAFNNQTSPELRLNFWTDYKREIDLAADLGVKVFRMGVDWGRLVPVRPDVPTCAVSGGIQNQDALAHYAKIVDYARLKGMKVMMTLFHHSAPKWFMETGGWTNAANSICFHKFGKDVVDALGAKVDYWVTLNEPAVHNMFVYVVGMWPPGLATPNPLDAISVPGTWKGAFTKANENMVAAHKELYNYIHDTRKLSTPVGIAHNVGWHKANRNQDTGGAIFASRVMNNLFLDLVASNIDYIGINYYGSEYVSGTGVAIRSDVEYSESGRAVNPYGLYALIKKFHHRYNVAFVNRTNHKTLPIIITENGISEKNDVLRPAYIVEHLLAVNQAIKEGIPVTGYVYWTVSDNWEWLDGYCPKFGLYSVDRTRNLERSPREFSVSQFKEIVKTGRITEAARNAAWNRVVAAHGGSTHDMCRGTDGKSSLNEPRQVAYANVDWRFDANSSSQEMTSHDPLDFGSKIDAITGTIDAKMPFWLRDDAERRKAIGSLLSLFDGFKQSKFSVALSDSGRFKLAVNVGNPAERTVCAVKTKNMSFDYVFDDSFYLTLPETINPNEIEIGIEGVRVFVGPRFSSNFNFRARLEKMKIVNGVLSFDSPDAPLLRNLTNDLLAPEPPPEFKCEKAPLTKFGNGFSQ